MRTAIMSFATPGQDQWRVRLAMARLWADAVNRRGGDATVVHLPEVGVRGLAEPVTVFSIP